MQKSISFCSRLKTHCTLHSFSHQDGKKLYLLNIKWHPKLGIPKITILYLFTQTQMPPNPPSAERGNHLATTHNSLQPGSNTSATTSNSRRLRANPASPLASLPRLHLHQWQVLLSLDWPARRVAARGLMDASPGTDGTYSLSPGDEDEEIMRANRRVRGVMNLFLSFCPGPWRLPAFITPTIHLGGNQTVTCGSLL